jgi:hypothetical protein
LSRVNKSRPPRPHDRKCHLVRDKWRVFDPSAIVRHRVRDIEETLAAALIQRARSIAREFTLDQVTDAEDAINEKLSGVKIDVTVPTGIEQARQDATDRGCLGAEYGLWTRSIALLRLDKAATDHNAKMMQLKWAIEEEEAAQRLRVIQNRNQQAITAERMDIYRKIIAAGDIERFALRLSDVVERWEISDQVREALEWLSDATARVVTGDYRNTETGQPLHQRRRGRGQPIEQSPASESPREVIVVTAEAVPLEEARTSQQPNAVEAGPAAQAQETNSPPPEP